MEGTIYRIRRYSEGGGVLVGGNDKAQVQSLVIRTGEFGCITITDHEVDSEVLASFHEGDTVEVNEVERNGKTHNTIKRSTQ